MKVRVLTSEMYPLLLRSAFTYAPLYTYVTYFNLRGHYAPVYKIVLLYLMLNMSEDE